MLPALPNQSEPPRRTLPAIPNQNKATVATASSQEPTQTDSVLAQENCQLRTTTPRSVLSLGFLHAEPGSLMMQESIQTTSANSGQSQAPSTILNAMPQQEDIFTESVPKKSWSVFLKSNRGLAPNTDTSCQLTGSLPELSALASSGPPRPTQRSSMLPVVINSQYAKFFAGEVSVSGPFVTTHADFVEKYLKQTYYLHLLHPTTPAVSLLKQLSAEAFNQEVDSIRVISNLLPEHANHAAFNRDVYHIPPYLTPENTNQTMLGAKGSAVRLGGGNDNVYIQPNAQVSILQSTTMMLNEESDNKIVNLYVLSVSAPALDDTSIIFTFDEFGVDPTTVNKKSKARPEMETYLDTSKTPPAFHKKNYELAHDTLGNHILTATQHCDPKRVVLSAFGMSSFLSALEVIDERASKPTCYKNTAQNIAAKSLAATIKTLQEEGKEVCFSDVLSKSSTERFATQTYWDRVNAALKMLNAKPLNPVNGTNSALGANWARKTDMLVNAWDPDSLVGNGLLMDKSFDGFFGCMTTANPVHMAACDRYNMKQQKILANQNKSTDF